MCVCPCRVKLVDAISPEQAKLENKAKVEKPVSNNKKLKKEKSSGYLDRRLKRLKSIALANSTNNTQLEEESKKSSSQSDQPKEEGNSSHGDSAGPSRVLMGRTENFVHEPFQQNQEVKVCEL